MLPAQVENAVRVAAALTADADAGDVNLAIEILSTQKGGHDS